MKSIIVNYIMANLRVVRGGYIMEGRVIRSPIHLALRRDGRTTVENLSKSLVERRVRNVTRFAYNVKAGCMERLCCFVTDVIRVGIFIASHLL